jgi:hypothetical protein
VVAVGLMQRSFALRLHLIVGCHHLLLQSGRLVLEESSSGSEEWESVSPSLVNEGEENLGSLGKAFGGGSD